MVAFVAEFSRGKSELINAIFFAGYKRRIMPASAGRTTMCPTELGYDADVPPCLRLLPIETRLQPQPLMEWRDGPEKWTRVDLDVNDPAQLAKAFEKVAEVRHVSKDEAKALGFWHDDSPEDNPMVDADGKVEVPRWRHALINIAHPLLKQGLVILDTPGLNAIGAEPELTVNLIPQAHAVVFILAADTGVTKSDLAIWREHLITESRQHRFAPGGAEQDRHHVGLAEHARPGAGADRAPARHLGRNPRPAAGAGDSGFGAEGPGRQGQRRREAAAGQPAARARAGPERGRDGPAPEDPACRRWQTASASCASRRARAINIRRRDLAEQMLELKGLRGKNTSVIKHMRSRIEQEQARLRRERRPDPRRALGAPEAAARGVHAAGHQHAQDRDGRTDRGPAPARHQAGRAQGLCGHLRSSARGPAQGAGRPAPKSSRC